jgi:hypothetical protein
MARCFTLTSLFSIVCLLIGLLSFVQLFLGIYATFINDELIEINRVVRTDQFNAYLFYILLAFIGLASISLLLTLSSIYGLIKRYKSFSFFVAILWVCLMSCKSTTNGFDDNLCLDLHCSCESCYLYRFTLLCLVDSSTISFVSLR